MHTNQQIRKKTRLPMMLTAVAAIFLGGCYGSDSPSVGANAQTISFSAAPPLSLGGTATVSATASSGLSVTYSSLTPAVCSVDGSTGLVTDLSAGTCIIAADQPGNARYAPAPQATVNIPVIFDPNQTITFGPAPSLSLFSTATVSATASSGLPVIFSSTTPAVCTVDSTTGLVIDLTAGTCIIAADQPGDVNFKPAPQETLVLTVSVPPGLTVPGKPTGVTATAGNAPNTVSISIGATDSGGTPITGYTVTSVPPGISGSGASSPVTVTCPSTCSGHSFAVAATNAIGSGPPSANADIITAYSVVATFYEPDTQPRNSIFAGSFTFNATTRTVANLGGNLSEAMTGNPLPFPNDNMIWVPLTNQLSSLYDPALGGLLVTTFKLQTTTTLWTGTGGDGWYPGSGFGLYYGYPGANPGNAYARIFVNTEEPTAAPTTAQLDKLAYADCSPGGMMGGTCMTGTSVGGYGTLGTMSGYPLSQLITKK
jgi:hypothetical protein